MRSPLLALTLFVFAAACNKTEEPTRSSSPAQSATQAAAAAAPSAAAPAKAVPADSPLLSPASAKDKAPDVFKAKFATTKGDFVIEVHRDWAPNGADRFYNLVKVGYFTGVKFFRAIEGFMVQFGINGDPAVNRKWQTAEIKDDERKQSNKKGFVTFATRGPNTRTTQIFISYGDNSRLDTQGFTPFGQVVQGMDIVDGLYKGYGEGAPMGAGPEQGRIQDEGNAYLEKSFPKLDAVKEATIVP